jgi:hypothetical protein
MNCFVLAFVLLSVQDSVPFKPKEEFEVKLNYEFRARPVGDHNSVNIGREGQLQARTSSGGVLPYVTLQITLYTLPDAKSRVMISNNSNARPVARRVSVNTPFELDLGFTVDMIDRVQPHEYTLTFVDANKNPVNRITISVDRDGSFFVNNEKRGRF